METTTSERVALMMSELVLDQPGFGKVAGASKSVVNQWLSGLIKKIAPRYAYAIDAKTRYSKEWVMFGTGDKYKDVIEGESRRVDEKITPELPSTVTIIKPATERETWMAELVLLAEKLDTLHLALLIGKARDFLAEQPAKQTPESFG